MQRIFFADHRVDEGNDTKESKRAHKVRVEVMLGLAKFGELVITPSLLEMRAPAAGLSRLNVNSELCVPPCYGVLRSASNTKIGHKRLASYKMPLKPTGPPLVPLVESRSSDSSSPPPLERIPGLGRRDDDDPFGDLLPPEYAPVGWGVQTHVFPAAYPRSKVGSAKRRNSEDNDNLKNAEVVQPTAVGLASNSKEVKEMVVEVLKRQREARVTDVGRDEEERQLWIAVNRYYRRSASADAQRGLTLVFAHANGPFPFFRFKSI
jgi:hypothetical protein